MTVLNDLFTIYWSQVTLIALGIGYLFKHLFESKARKKEINYTFFQERKLNALKNFLESYSKNKLMWESIPILKIIDNSISAKELDKIIFINIDELQLILLEVKMFFNDKEYEKFDLILQNILKINGFVKEQYFDDANEKKALVKSNNYHSLTKKIFTDNNILVNEILNLNRKSFS